MRVPDHGELTPEMADGGFAERATVGPPRPSSSEKPNRQDGLFIYGTFVADETVGRPASLAEC
jgi:hypothetical protein